jgi:hypothetical protein
MSTVRNAASRISGLHKKLYLVETSNSYTIQGDGKLSRFNIYTMNILQIKIIITYIRTGTAQKHTTACIDQQKIYRNIHWSLIRSLLHTMVRLGIGQSILFLFRMLDQHLHISSIVIPRIFVGSTCMCTFPI